MAYELKQELRLGQSLVMTPQLQLAIRLLQLSRLDIVELVREEVQSNPVLEAEGGIETPEDLPAKEPTEGAPEVDWQSYIEAYSDSGPTRTIDFNDRGDEDEGFGENISSVAGGLREHLLWQLGSLVLPEDEHAACEFIIGSIEDDGYLRLVDNEGLSRAELEAKTLLEISVHAGVGPEVAQRALGVVQQFDPSGVGARTLSECLLIQALALPVRDTTVEQIAQAHLENLANRNFKRIAKDLGITQDEVLSAAAFINKCLNPTPGSGFGRDESKTVVPDVYVNKVGDDYVITLNEDGLPRLKVSRYYRDILKGECPGEAKGYIQEKLRSAMWLIKSMHQRQRTIYRVVECMVRFQREFLEKGLKYLKPMVLKDVAMDLGVHESTVSRVTSNKYVQTPRGIFELKYFFSGGLNSSAGEEMAVEYIKKKIGDIIKAEDSKSPLSDMQIVEKLKESGIDLARRTAMKYREALGYQSSTRRKVHF